MKKILLDENLNFYRANLHCHTTVSDGKKSPDEIKKFYMQHGYSVVAYTDHDVFIPHNDLTDDKFIALNAMEISPTGNNHTVQESVSVTSALSQRTKTTK